MINKSTFIIVSFPYRIAIAHLVDQHRPWTDFGMLNGRPHAMYIYIYLDFQRSPRPIDFR